MYITIDARIKINKVSLAFVKLNNVKNQSSHTPNSLSIVVMFAVISCPLLVSSEAQFSYTFLAFPQFAIIILRIMSPKYGSGCVKWSSTAHRTVDRRLSLVYSFDWANDCSFLRYPGSSAIEKIIFTKGLIR